MSEHTHPHFHFRKRIYQKHEKYPHPDRFKRNFDKFILFAGTIGPLMAIPQLYKIYSSQDASGISFISFTAYAFFNVMWVIYGVLHKEKPIIIVYILWFIMNTSVATGVLLYN